MGDFFKVLALVGVGVVVLVLIGLVADHPPEWPVEKADIILPVALFVMFLVLAILWRRKE